VRRDALKAEVRNMRAKMRENLSKAKAGQFDIKQDAAALPISNSWCSTGC
jgi:glutamine synthetase adenylyltransferase